MKLNITILLGASVLAMSSMGLSAQAQTLDIKSGGGVGAHPNFPVSNVFDGDLSFESRWVGNGSPESVILNLYSTQSVNDVRIAWGRGESRAHTFDISGRSDLSGPWTPIFSGTSSGTTIAFENYNVDDMDARQIRIRGLSNSHNIDWTQITEIQIIGPDGPTDTTIDPIDPVAIPARVQAEDFIAYYDTNIANLGGAYRDTPVDIHNTRDTGGGYSVGWTNAGEWLEYEIDVDEAGAFDAGLRVAQRLTGAIMSIEVDGVNRTGNISLDSTGGWQSYYTETVSLGDLSAGQHTVRVNFENGGVFLNAIDFTPTEEPETPINEFGLDPAAYPWENFDLRYWKVDTPAGSSSATDCKAQKTEPDEWDNLPSSRSAPYFFTHTDGGMRFVSEIGGGTTGGSCDSRTRSELREMLRGSDRSIDTTGRNGDYRNNWALGYQPTTHGGNSGESWGAREGKMSATLRVNKVTTTGKDSSRGRTVIGQIHADNDEPIRINYKHREGFAGGCIYASSEQRNGDDTNFVLAGSNTSCSQDPGANGLGLGELFSYEIENIGEDIIVTIFEGDRGPVINSVTIDLNDIEGNYDVADDWMYFKAGAYTQNSINDEGEAGDGDIVTFYRLDVVH